MPWQPHHGLAQTKLQSTVRNTSAIFGCPAGRFFINYYSDTLHNIYSYIYWQYGKHRHLKNEASEATSFISRWEANLWFCFPTFWLPKIRSLFYLSIYLLKKLIKINARGICKFLPILWVCSVQHTHFRNSEFNLNRIKIHCQLQ